MTNKKENEEDNLEESDRRTRRTTRRPTRRATTLTRKKTEASDKAEPKAEKDEPAKRRVTAKRASKASGAADDAVARKPVRKRRAPAKKATPKGKSEGTSSAPALRKKSRSTTTKKAESSPENDGFELRALPDGTLKRAETSAKKAAKKSTVRRAPRGDQGPGPAIVPLEDSHIIGAGRRSTKISLGALRAKTRRSVNYLKKKFPHAPKVAVILGSGLNEVAQLATTDQSVDFADVPGFMAPTVPGHDGVIKVGAVEGTQTLFCEGRLHYYETASMADLVYPIQTFLCLGVERFIFTTSSGALNQNYAVGDIMFVNDHINMMGDNPVFGADPLAEPSIFVDSTSIYDEGILGLSERLSRRARVKSHAGALVGVRGPIYETPAERKWLSSIGGDAVCMSVIPEAITAAQSGASVTGLAVIVNDAGHASKQPVSHEEVLLSGQKSARGLKRLISAIIGQGW